jgi:ribonuclease HII
VGRNPGGDPTNGPPSGSKVRELLAFDLALLGWQAAARPCGAPSLFPSDPDRAKAPPRRTLAGFDEAGRGALAGPIVVGCVQVPRELLAEADRVTVDLGRVDDSKRLTARAREAAFLGIARCAVLAVGCASAREIDAVGIVEAARRAACRAYRRLGASCDLAVFDRGLSMGAAVALDPGCSAQSAKQLGSSSETYGCRTPDLSLGIGCRRSLSSLSSRSRRAVELGRSVGASAPNELSPDVPPGVAFTKGDMRSLHVAAASIVAKVTRDHLMERLDAAFPGFEWSRHKGYGTEEHRRAILRLGPSPIHRRTFLHFVEEAQSQSC